MPRFMKRAVCWTLPALAAALTSAPLLVAQGGRRTPDGRPDLQGMWLNDTATPLERPLASMAKASLSDAEARDYEARYQLDRTVALSRSPEFELKAAGDLDTYVPGRLLPGNRTGMITDPPDGRVPALTPEAQARVNAQTERVRTRHGENPENLTNAERCLLVGNTSLPPMLPAFYNNLVQIVQTRDYVVILSEMIHDARIVPLDRRAHLPASLGQWKGDSIGHWEGDTLIVETTNFTDKTGFRGASPRLHIVERFSLSDRNTLRYQFTLEDPSSFARSWSGESAMSRTASQMFEYACHEANYSLPAVLRGGRLAEQTNATSK